MSGLRVAVLALSAKSYGGDSYFRGLAGALERCAHEDRFSFLIREDAEPPAGLERVRFRTCRAPGLSRGAAHFLWSQTVLPGILAREGFDVLFTASNTGVLRSPVPFVTAVHNMEPLRPPAGNAPLHRLRNAALRRLTLLSARRAARVVAVSEFVRDALIEEGVPAAKIDVIYHGIDWTPSPPPGRREGYVAGAGKFIRYANLELLLRGFAEMRRRGYEGELRFAGGGYDAAYEREMRTLASELGVAERVRFLGYLPREEVHRLMRGCDAFLHPSTLEACPFSLLEAMSEGAPVVTTRCRPMPEICAKAALYAEPDDPEGFGRAALRAASKPEVRMALRKRSLERAKDFRWDENVRRLLETLRKAAG